MAAHVVKRREARRSGLWSVWCSCGWAHDCLTKLPDAVRKHHLASSDTTGAACEMRATPNDYRRN